MKYSKVYEGFRLAYERHGQGDAIVLLHGWPGDHTDYDQLVPLLKDHADVVVPDLRGFGLSDKHEADAEYAYSGEGQARAVIALLDELKLTAAIVCGYDVGSFIAQTIARLRPDLVKALVVSPPLPGAGVRVLELKEAMEFWYTSFHNLDLFEQLVDGKYDATRAYLHHFWSHWSGPDHVVGEDRIDHLAEVYSAPGAFTASVAWYRSSSNPVTAYACEVTPETAERLTTPTTILWQETDPIFPFQWSDRLDAFFTNFILEPLPGIGHFTPLEATEKFAAAIHRRLNHES
ncbi:alpha/beta fold hydrolase [Pseudomonas sp. NPDC088444]|uniref:alpha/beta fold hydrolase n=1 Tax=Pseudomonas sp. NPDC088444 TaxID=3364456 RepID=UPI003850DD0B